MMYDIDHEKKEVWVSTKDVPIGSIEDRMILCLASRGYTIREKSACTALALANSAPFVGGTVRDDKSNMYKKYEVVYQMRKSPDSEFESTKYLARVIGDTADDIRAKIKSTYVKIIGVYPVGRVRADYLRNRKVDFHSIGVM